MKYRSEDDGKRDGQSQQAHGYLEETGLRLQAISLPQLVKLERVWLARN